MDQFLLSASSNQLFVHQLGLPPSQQNCPQCTTKSEDFWFKSVHQVKMGNCKNITAIGAHNQVKFDPYWPRPKNNMRDHHDHHYREPKNWYLAVWLQFYSHVVLIACSDKTLQIYDTNAQKILRNMGQCHAKPVNKITMVNLAKVSWFCQHFFTLYCIFLCRENLPVLTEVFYNRPIIIYSWPVQSVMEPNFGMFGTKNAFKSLRGPDRISEGCLWE